MAEIDKLLGMNVKAKQTVEKSLVRKILENPVGLQWTLQGLGMLRLYLDDTRRMHVWDDRYKVKDVSQIHTHPWNFKSTIVAGKVKNKIFIEVSDREPNHFKQSIFCGTGGGLEGSPERVALMLQLDFNLFEGDIYEELAHEIHVSAPERGTVTIIEREYLEDADHAFVYWEDGWVSAEPRPATTAEILDICGNSLVTWFK